jgi:hypothetical protein
MKRPASVLIAVKHEIFVDAKDGLLFQPFMGDRIFRSFAAGFHAGSPESLSE